MLTRVVHVKENSTVCIYIIYKDYQNMGQNYESSETKRGNKNETQRLKSMDH